jgi:hypothetical protein
LGPALAGLVDTLATPVGRNALTASGSSVERVPDASGEDGGVVDDVGFEGGDVGSGRTVVVGPDESDA